MRNTRKRPIEDRFWEKVKVSGTDDCWEWQGTPDRHGYGRINTSSPNVKSIFAHRLSYQIANGEIPDGMVIMHACDNPSCVNPRHLSAGSQSDNLQDAAIKNRMCKHGQRAISEKDAEEIRRQLSQGKLLQREIAEMFGVSRETITGINIGKTYKQMEQANV